MKKRALVVCLMALMWHISLRPSLAEETKPPLHAVDRPIAAAIAPAADNYSHLLSQTGGNRISRRQGTIIAVAAAIGFGVGYGVVYFKNRPLDCCEKRAYAMASGVFSAFIAGGIAWVVVVGP